MNYRPACIGAFDLLAIPTYTDVLPQHQHTNLNQVELILFWYWQHLRTFDYNGAPIPLLFIAFNERKAVTAGCSGWNRTNFLLVMSQASCQCSTEPYWLQREDSNLRQITTLLPVARTLGNVALISGSSTRCDTISPRCDIIQSVGFEPTTCFPGFMDVRCFSVKLRLCINRLCLLYRTLKRFIK